MAVARVAAPMWLAAGIFLIGLAPARAEPCPGGDAALGVSRTVEIDTTGGPKFGAQYPGNDFLQPGEIVLTFDDGPSRAKTPAILSALAAHCTKGTFLIVGRMALVEPELLREVAHAGRTDSACTPGLTRSCRRSPRQRPRKKSSLATAWSRRARPACCAILPLSVPGRIAFHACLPGRAQHRHAGHRYRQ